MLTRMPNCCGIVSEIYQLSSEMLRESQHLDRAYIVEKISQGDVLLKLYSDHVISRHPPVVHRKSTRRCQRDHECTKWLSKTTIRRAGVLPSIGTIRTGAGSDGDSGSGSDEELSSISSSKISSSSVFGECGLSSSIFALQETIQPAVNEIQRFHAREVMSCIDFHGPKGESGRGINVFDEVKRMGVEKRCMEISSDSLRTKVQEAHRDRRVASRLRRGRMKKSATR